MDHDIDLNRRIVTKKQRKAYKFDANFPFEITKRVEHTPSSILLNLSVRNTSPNAMFLDTVNFANPSQDFIVEDFSSKGNKSLFDSAVVF